MRYAALKEFRARAEEVAETFSSDSVSLDIYWRAINAIPAAGVAALQEKYRSDLGDYDPIGPFKYADLPFWIADKVNVARSMGLDRGRSRTILDIGMGAGHFSAVCNVLGHKTVGTDISVPLYDDICQLLGVERRIEPVTLRKPMNSLNSRFDLVTIIWQIFHICRFYDSGMRDHWTPEDWRFLLNDLIANHMELPGDLFLLLNVNVSPAGEAFDQELLKWFHERGAMVDNQMGKVVFKDVLGPLPQEPKPFAAASAASQQEAPRSSLPRGNLAPERSGFRRALSSLFRRDPRP